MWGVAVISQKSKMILSLLALVLVLAAFVPFLMFVVIPYGQDTAAYVQQQAELRANQADTVGGEETSGDEVVVPPYSGEGSYGCTHCAQ